MFVIGTDNLVHAEILNAAGTSSGGYFLAAAGAVKAISATRDASGNPLLFTIGSDNQAHGQNFNAAGHASGAAFTITGTVRAIKAGLDATGKYYLPFGETNEGHLNYEPTILPEAVGGYFWVVFTSHRSYGNILPSRDNMDQNGKLWVAAIDLNPTAGQDPSHPAFFLDGQENTADNLRGFWVRDPCKQAGATCMSGDECCDGFCRPGDSGMNVCGPPTGGCSNEFEKCTTAADCCMQGYQCINGFCARPPPR